MLLEYILVILAGQGRSFQHQANTRSPLTYFQGYILEFDLAIYYAEGIIFDLSPVITTHFYKKYYLQDAKEGTLQDKS